jgi:DNA repair exonuclease SbcCD ATPase subunit
MPRESPAQVVCPVCHAKITPDEFHALHQGSAEALETLRAEYRSEIDAKEAESTRRLAELDERRKTDLKQLREERAESIRELKQQHQESLGELKRIMAETQREQLEQLSESHRHNLEQLQADLAQSREKEKRWGEERSNLRKESEETVARLNEEFAAREKALADRAMVGVAEELAKKDQQIRELRTSSDHLQRQIEELRASAQRGPSDITGEAGEYLLKETLEAAFPKDEIRKVSRPGLKTADVVQRIFRAPGVFTPTVIAVDNKSGKKVTAKDLTSARSYREIHRTDYVIIVTDEMAKEAGDRVVVDDQGILIVKRPALISVIDLLRRQILKLDQARASGENRDTKETRLFEYIRGDEFQRNLRRLLALDLKEMELLRTEKHSHENMWKQRERLRVERDEAVSQVETSTSAASSGRVRGF